MNKNFLFLTLSYLLYSIETFALSYSEFDPFQKTLTRSEIEQRLQLYLQKDVEIANYFELTNSFFYLYASPQDKANQHPEYALALSSEKKQALPTKQFPLNFKDLRIAIDPGHVGGNFAQIEERHVYMKPKNDSQISEEIRFDEATLNLMTAKVLKQLLEKDNIQVLLTKEKNGCAVFEKDFWKWREEQLPTTLTSSQVFRKQYNPLDLQARADKINAFNPHLSLIIHYNAHGNIDPITGENIPANENYNMVFIGGSFCKGELKEPQSRYEFLRLLLTKDLDLSIELSREILQNFTKHLAVLPIKIEEQISYLKKMSIKIEDGVYARNLALTRLIHGPLCYGETLCQDHIQECVILNNKDFTIGGMTGPHRVEQVAQAYYEGIKSFLKLKSKP